MNIASLCEAVSFQEGMDVFEADDIIEPEIISRNCGCLLRKSLDGNYFEFAHFTVLEYLERTEVGDFQYSEVTAYQSFVQASIGYLLLPHFDRVPTIIDTVEEAYAKERNQKHPFYKFATYTPLGVQRSTSTYPMHLKVMEEEPVLELLKRLFDIHKTGNFRAWAHTVLSGGQNELSTMHQLSNGPLHFAVLILSPKLCQFLIDSGVDVNVVRDNSTPLAMTIALKDEGFLGRKMKDPQVIDCMIRTINVLLDNGADTAFPIMGHSCMAYAIDSLDSHYLLQFIRPTSAVPEDAVTAFSNFEWKDESDDLVLKAILKLLEKKLVLSGNRWHRLRYLSLVDVGSSCRVWLPGLRLTIIATWSTGKHLRLLPDLDWSKNCRHSSQIHVMAALLLSRPISSC